MKQTALAQRGNTRIYIIAALLALGLGLAWQTLLNGTPQPPQLQTATHLQPPRTLQGPDLVDHRGEPFDQARLRGHWTFIFFGYMHCPDVCPTTMTTLNAAAKQIGTATPDLPAPQYVFVSIDPERDTPEQLARFVPYFNPDFIGATGTEEAIAALTRQLGILYLKTTESGDGGYLMDHTASILLIDPDARLHALFSPPLAAPAIAADFAELRRFYEESQ